MKKTNMKLRLWTVKKRSRPPWFMMGMKIIVHSCRSGEVFWLLEVADSSKLIFCASKPRRIPRATPRWSMLRTMPRFPGAPLRCRCTWDGTGAWCTCGTRAAKRRAAFGEAFPNPYGSTTRPTLVLQTPQTSTTVELEKSLKIIERRLIKKNKN